MDTENVKLQLKKKKRTSEAAQVFQQHTAGHMMNI